ncbi:glycosyltransferase involved in cell wall biosynthesis [Psychromicrobium silvestre]|uniref:Glycosyltransferase involved in cell wall biosynthesis n=1 Tax=Psychromicrobium silvestre TaxID=1645614 RepID=A0A7Y9LS49_9MICC|nr:glycosyltransferase [Psychromicrobium silvestre]NYE94602.1 glycosyltransferase involved in cell wall biosynthesis [Psychromicrobium silvestre]
MENNQKRQVAVICPTEYGGQIEHAADLAMAIAAEADVEQCFLVSRPGAAAYLGTLEQPGVRLLEVLPPRRLTGGRVQNLLRPLRQVIDLLTEHRAIRRVSRTMGDDGQLVLETSKYPLASLLRAGKRIEVVLFVHNAKPHFDRKEAGFRQRLLMGLETSSMKTADRVVTHGKNQGKTLSEIVGDRLSAVSLPMSSRLSNPQELSKPESSAYDLKDSALCIGELRSNKGVELAMSAADTAQVPLLVAGKSDEEETRVKLAALAASSEYVTLQDRFLERSEFDQYLQSARLVVLPYTHFDAQSGVLTKAMHAKAAIFASDLPSLREQAGDYSAIEFADHRDPAGFADGLAKAFQAGQRAAQNADLEDFSDWKLVAGAVLGGRRNQT